MAIVELTSSRREIHYIKCMVYGESGVGKTMLCATAPNPVIISSEEGLLCLADKDVPVVEVTNLKSTLEAIKWAKTCQFDTVCLDSLSELGEVLLNEFKKDEKDPRKAYLKMGEELTGIMRMLRAMPKHVVVICKQGINKDDLLGKTTYAPGAPGQAFTSQVPYFLDLLFAYRIKKEGRFLQTQPSFQYMAKDRSGKLNVEEQPNLEMIFNKILTKRN